MPINRAHPPSLSLPQNMQYKNLLFDFYGGLLTDKQRECFSMHYMHDLSLAEIGEQSGITPQAVADLLKRSCALLDKYEQKLALVEKLNQQRAHTKVIAGQLDTIAQIAHSAGLEDIVELTDKIRMSVKEMVL